MPDFKFVLAPMDGMTHAAFRQICFEYGADGATTEMISAASYAYARRSRPALKEGLARFPAEGCLAAQLIGCAPKDMALSARKLTALKRFDAIDINMGCPARKVVGSGNGSAIMRDFELAERIMRAVRENTELPVRLKIRLGWDNENITAVEIAQAAEALGFESVTLHGRTRMQMYNGVVDISAMRRVREAISIPLYANGGVACAQDALTFLKETGADGVSIGRAALKQPWIFDDIHRLNKGLPIIERDATERVGVLLRLARLLCILRPERLAICEIRKFCAWMLSGFMDAQALLPMLNQTPDLMGFERLMEDYINRLLCMGDVQIHPELAPDLSLNTMKAHK